jgi:hypothetical protein
VTRTNVASQVTPQEAVKLGAVDSVFYSRFFFPKTFRQPSPQMHREIWANLEDPAHRYVALAVFRDGAKTTILRAFASKMIAYGLAHTILIIGKSESAARRTNRWLMKQVEMNSLWAQTFGLVRGKKWTEEEFEILHGIEQYPITVLAFGMTGSIRGVNIEDYRPDLIIVDDPCNTENTATPEQREKTKTLLFADIAKTLAPRSEAPHAKMVLLQTPLARDDAIDLCIKDPEWKHSLFSCFDEKGRSRWEERYPTEELKRDKEHHIRRGQLGLWMREKECKIVSTEMAAFRAENLKIYQTLPDHCSFIMAIDPASSDSKDADFLAMAVLAFCRGDVYLADYRLFKGYDFDYLAAEFFHFLRIFRPRLVVVEEIAYQRTLIWHLRREMENRRIFATITPVKDRRRKADRIIQALGGLSAMGHLYCRESHVEFIQQFTEYGPLVDIHDDLLDAVAMGVTASNPALDGIVLEGEARRIAEEEKGIEPLLIEGCP